ncbi:uncharacterized protein DUF4199 [Pontibacter mucosus]|uniref:Uncharacterized protein DUF4199 n=2 Tax=Pontibacter mucosus TaxID=1649266 RepID=A0A2T5YNZ8_9BACT|nr:uncharacterized protein DUF4199 [Pontibacter mucosus]
MTTMTEKQPSVGAVALKWGFIFGLIGVVYTLVLMVADLMMNPWLSSLTYLILAAGIAVAMKNYREENNGFMSYGQGLGIGAIVSFLFGLVTGIFSWVYTNFIDTEYMSRMMEKQRVQMLEQGLTDEQIDAAMAFSENFKGPLTAIFGSAIVMLIIGFILSLIIAAIMKRSRPEFE